MLVWQTLSLFQMKAEATESRNESHESSRLKELSLGTGALWVSFLVSQHAMGFEMGVAFCVSVMLAIAFRRLERQPNSHHENSEVCACDNRDT